MTFDLEKAKYDLDAYPEENRFEWTGDALDKIMDQMQEIERLQASLIDLHAEYINTLEKNPECSAWDLDEQSDADQRRLRKNAAHAISIVEPLIYLQADQRAVHVQELEDALDESEKVVAYKSKFADHWYQECLQKDIDIRQANYLHNHMIARIRRLEDTLRDAIQPGDADKINVFLRDCMCPDSEGPHDCSMCSEDSIEFCDLLKRVQMASQQLQAESKIGPDATRRYWQITDERRDAIVEAEYAMLLVDDHLEGFGYAEERAVLRAMLKETGQ